MIDIAIALYLISLLSSLSDVGKYTLAATFLVGMISPLFCMLFDDLIYRQRGSFVKMASRYIKIYLFAVIIPAVFFTIAVPSERTMYMIAGLYASDKVINTVADSDIAKQAERTLLAKLQELEKEYLVEEKTDDSNN